MGWGKRGWQYRNRRREERSKASKTAQLLECGSSAVERRTRKDKNYDDCHVKLSARIVGSHVTSVNKSAVV